MNKIPFSKPFVNKQEAQAAYDTVLSGNLAMGSKVKELEEKFAEYVGSKYAVAFNGCTNALLSAIDILDFGEYIKVPAITYTATASVVVQSGRRPVFVDVDKNLLAIGADIPVHLAGRKYEGEAKIYDSAHRIEKGDLKDSKGISCFSFYATKNMTTGYGGMACTNNEDYYKELKIIQNDGRVKSKPIYSIVRAVGGRDMDDIHASIGLIQLSKLQEMTILRNSIVERYNKNLGLNRVGNHLYPILVNEREKFQELLSQAGIQSSIHFIPLHKQSAYEKYHPVNNPDVISDNEVLYRGNQLPNAEYFGERLVSLPLFPQMTNEEIDYVSDEVLKTKLLINE